MRAARILVAASPEPRAVVERMLAGHVLSCAETMAQASRLLQTRTFELILCTIVFDESRMFDLLTLAKSKTEWQQIPFVGARVRAHLYRKAATLKAAATTCREMGAAAFLDIADYKLEPERQMREAIEGFLA
jgi:hypothetical protein